MELGSYDVLAPSINRTTGHTVQPDPAAASSSTSNLRQRTEPATQRASHSLGSIGKRMAKSVGKLFQKSKKPTQAAVSSTSTSTSASASASASASKKPSDEQAARDAARQTRNPGSRLQGADGLNRSLQRSDPTDRPAGDTRHSNSEAEEPSSEQPSLQRSNGGRFTQQQDTLVRNTHPPATDTLHANSEADEPSSEQPSLRRSNGGRFTRQQDTLMRTSRPSHEPLSQDTQNPPDSDARTRRPPVNQRLGKAPLLLEPNEASSSGTAGNDTDPPPFDESRLVTAGGRFESPQGALGQSDRTLTSRLSNPASGASELPPPPGGPTLQRNNGGRFAQQDDNLVRTTRPQGSVTLNAKGKPDFSTFTTPGLAPLLTDILATSKQTYTAVQSKPGDEHHLLLESSGHLLQLTQNETSLVVLRSSQQMSHVAEGATSLVTSRAPANAGQVILTQEPPPKAAISHITGVYQHPDVGRLRLHDGQLNTFDSTKDQWKVAENGQEVPCKSLAIGGNGVIYAQVGDTVGALSTGLKSTAQINDLKSFSIASDGTAALLGGDDAQTVLMADLKPDATVPMRARTLVLGGGQAQAAAVGLSADRLFVADTQGRLYSVLRSDLARDRESVTLEPEQDGYRINNQPLGGHNVVTGFISGENGRVHALIKNRQGEVHTHSLDEQNASLEKGWNLTDALALDKTSGLNGATAPAPADRLNLDRSGLVGLSEGRVQRWDATPQCWKDAGIKDVDRLQRGADSNAYALMGGKLLKLTVTPEHPSIAFGPHSALAQTARSTKVEIGKEIEGLEDRVITAFAMVNAERFVAVDDQNVLTAHRKDGKPIELDAPGLQGTVNTLALDEKHNLYAHTSTGGLFCLPKEGWQAKTLGEQLQARWTEVPTPGGQPLKALYSNDDNLLSAQIEDAPDQGLMRLKNGKWEPFTQRPVEENGLNDVHSRIKRSQKTWRIPGTGLTVRQEVNTLGRGGMEKSKPASTREFIASNIWKSSGFTPRWTKNVGNHLQHRYHGREGLKALYKQESIVFKQLELIHETAGTNPTPGNDLKARIARLNLGPAGATLVKELEALRDDLEKHSTTALTSIGKSYGTLKNLGQQDGALNQLGEVAKPSARTGLGKRLAELGSALNYKSSGHDLIAELENALARVAPSADNPTGKILKELKDNGVKISHQKADIPLGQRRDAGEDQGLTKARLALDLVTLKKLGDLLDQAELLTPQSDMSVMQKRLSTLRDDVYGENPIKLATDMGFTDNAALESAYDSVKTFLKSFKKSDHAVSVNMRAATGSKDQAQLASTFKSMLKQLEHGDDEIGLVRSYGLNVTSPFAILADKVTGPWPTAGTTSNRNYILNAERGEGGITLYLMSEMAGNLSGGVGAGKDYWPGFFDEKNPRGSVYLGNKHNLLPNLRLGGELTATAAGSQRSGVVFTVADEDIDGFVDDLFEGKLNPLQVLKKAVDHEAIESRRFNFDVIAGGTAEFRAGFELSDSGSTPFSAVARLGVAANVTVNLLTYTDYSLTQKNDKTELREGGKNRPRFLNTLAVGAQARAQLSGTHAHSTPASAPGTTPATQSAANNLGTTANLTIDRRTVKRVKFRYNVATPMTRKSVDKLSTSLGAAFKDAATTASLAKLADPLDERYAGKTPQAAIQAHLEGLCELFDGKQSQNDDQYKALRGLKRARVQDDASAKNHSVLDNARFETSKTDLSGLDSESILTKIMSSVREASAPGNAKRVAELMRQDPKLSALIKAMQGSDGTLARVRLEPKDSLLDEIDEGSREGSMTQGDLSALLGDRNKMRIKRLVVFHTATQSEDFTSPTPLVSYNSGATLNITKTLGRINFVYGEDQDMPIGYTFDGELSRPSEALKEAADLLKQQGFELKS
ncbi:AvrE-family type 3 secretion system effector [Pseudomonas californiensis]|uniref:AvrE-family type 3 secretion system effector n=1 Tax=Pseudomonas californiensis TaxID=2829823 RepID=UPI001E3FF7FC|nr:AvrE-family type 3 secretion system effector [Pseudomonas californiensis]